MSAEAACTQGFLEYCHIQVSKRVISPLQPVITELGWYVRQVRTQTVWLTATLPPVMQEEFFKTRPGPLVKRAADLVQAYWPLLQPHLLLGLGLTTPTYGG
ncbi:hypothetical protein ACEPPN_000649 [Leptodophora sp. 'Broadleaf-Isolate-01']